MHKTSKGYRRFQSRVKYFQEDLETAMVLFKNEGLLAGSAYIFENVSPNYQPCLSKRQNSSSSRLLVLGHMKKTLYIAFIKELYEEARNIFNLSPKGSCAILRLALQKLCNQIAEKDEKTRIDETIKDLVKNGLPSSLQKSMDAIRIIGNEAVHPGQINIDDNKDIAIALFKLMNIIVEKMIIEPKEIDDIYNFLPDNKIEGINKRDGKSN